MQAKGTCTCNWSLPVTLVCNAAYVKCFALVCVADVCTINTHAPNDEIILAHTGLKLLVQCDNTRLVF